jgi:cytochrome bd-type quinol oxidase subunit 1
MAAVFLLAFDTWTFAQDAASKDYRDIPYIGSRNAVWIIAQIHLLFGGFVLGVPIFALISEIIGILTKDKRYDALAKEFTKLLTASFGTTATFGGILLFLFVVCYPKLFNYLTEVFYPTYFFYSMLFIGETISLYLYWYGWDAMANKKGLHIFLGLLLNVFGLLIMFTSDAWMTYQVSPVVVSSGMSFWEKLWASIHNPTWGPVNIHRFIGNIVLGGFMCGAYAGLRYLGAKSQEERAHYDWMGYIGNFIGIFGLLPLPFAGYWLMREIYQYNQQMGITLMGGFLSWLFILQAVLIGVLFLGANYYFWQGLLTRAGGGLRYKTYITVMLVVLLICLGIWMTPHSLVASMEEARKMGGTHHPVLGVFGVMSAKMTVVNIMILTTLVSFLLYWRANKEETVGWAKGGKIAQSVIFAVAAGFVIWAGIYGYFVPAIIRVNYLSVAQVLAVLFVLLTVIPLTGLMLKGARMTGKMTWGIMPPSSQYALILNAVMVILLMCMMGYARSASRTHWHIYGVMRDTSPHAYTPALGEAALYQALCAFLFCLMVSFIFWVAALPEKKGLAVQPAEVKPKYFRKAFAFVTTILVAYTALSYSMPQKRSLPPEEEKIDFAQITTPQQIVQIGQKIFFGKGQCALCHTIGPAAHGQRAPELLAIGGRLTREFMYESITEPAAYVKEDYGPPDPKSYAARMPQINKPPIALNEVEILSVISFLQSQGGKVTVTPADLMQAQQKEAAKGNGTDDGDG